MSALPLGRLLLLALIALPACSGPPSDGGGSGGGGGGGTGGAPATGGEPGSGGAPATGGEPASGGAPATGGAASSGFEEIRCWRYQQTTDSVCWARFGNLWASVWHECTHVGEVRNPMMRNQMECGGVDDGAGWDETWCDDYPACFGRLGDWYIDLIAGCESPMGVVEPTGQTPAEAFCGATEAPTGWGNVACYDEGVIAPGTLCFGSHGIYYPTWGLLPTCEISDEIDQDPNYTPIALEDAIDTFCN